MTMKANNPAFRISILSRSDGRMRSPAVARQTLADTNAPSMTSAIPLPLANPENYQCGYKYMLPYETATCTLVRVIMISMCMRRPDHKRILCVCVLS